ENERPDERETLHMRPPSRLVRKTSHSDQLASTVTAPTLIGAAFTPSWFAQRQAASTRRMAFKAGEGVYGRGNDRAFALDEHGFVRTDVQLRADERGETLTALGRAPLPFETSVPGVFAVGDVRHGLMR